MTTANSSSDPLRIALVTLADLAVPGGIRRTIELLREGLTQRGHHVQVVTCPLRESTTPELVRRAWRRVSPSTEEFTRIRRASGRARDAVALLDVDVCLAMSAWAARSCVLAGRPTVFRMAGDGSITDEWLRNGFIAHDSSVVETLRAWESEGTQGAAHCVALGESGRRSLLAVGVANERIDVIPNGCTVPELTSDHGADADERDDALRIVAVGNLRPAKGADVLARALAALPDDLRSRVRLTHLGDGNDESNPTYAAARDALATGDVRAEFRGAVPRDEVRRTLADADVFVLPSRVESFGNALVEAIAHGLPVVATDVGAVREILGTDAATAGLIVPPDDSAALCGALTMLLRSPDSRRGWAKRNSERARAEFSLETMLDRYERVFAEAGGAG